MAFYDWNHDGKKDEQGDSHALEKIVFEMCHGLDQRGNSVLGSMVL